MLGYLTRRVALSAVVLVGLSLLVFAMVNLSGDPVRLLLPPDASAAEVARFRTAMGFDDPLPVRYLRFLSHAVRLDFGTSIQLRDPALGLVLDRLPATLQLAGLAVVAAIALGVPLGVLTAVKRDTPWDTVVTSLALIGQSTPVFWVGVMSILLFAVRLRWLPSSGIGTWEHLVLPVGTLTLFLLGGLVRVTRTSMLEVLNRPYVRTATAKGQRRRIVVWKHAFRNALIPVVTQIGLQMRFVIGGSVITETIFAWPGLGRLLVDAVYARDYPVVEAGVFVVALLLIVVNTLVDLSYAWLNPKVSLA
ncbi:MAG: ABC transporter permease subunit [Deinococcus-Thermus bacterium]|nr:ABC transporter permease subunit [Deinococcota bacterium]